MDSTGALALAELPGRMVVIGGGYIGLELGTVYAKLGTKVTVVEALDSILKGMDPDCTRAVARKLRKMGVEVMLEAKAQRWEDKGDRVVLTVATADGSEVAIDTDKILVSVGRRPNSENLGLDRLGVKTDGRGYIAIDNQLRTNVPGIYAIGDVAGGMPYLAHKASKEGEIAAEVIAGHKAARDYPQGCRPRCFTDPEIASTVGLTEAEAKERRVRQVKSRKVPLRGVLGRAISRQRNRRLHAR